MWRRPPGAALSAPWLIRLWLIRVGGVAMLLVGVAIIVG